MKGFQPILISCLLLLALTHFWWIQRQQKTVAGDNLQAPPWHTMRRIPLWSSLLRVPVAIQCASLVCEDEVATAAQVPEANATHPDYFRWMLEDLKPWSKRGITRYDLENAKKTATFRVIIYKGKLYVDLYYRCIQSRMMFTLWGLLNLLDRFPGQVPDVELLFNCQDRPQVRKQDYSGRVPPPLFGYSSSDKHFDIPFPDFSFWGWPEIHISPWANELVDILSEAEHQPWRSRDLRAHWKGNVLTNPIRKRLLECKSDYAETHAQNWLEEVNLNASRVSNQCGYGYKVYAEGYSWSAGLKYALACGSPMLVIDHEFYDFFSRGLISNKHFVPIQANGDLCQSIKRAVEWGNNHPSIAETMAARSQKFATESLSMDNVYRYMLQLLREYAKLQRFQPVRGYTQQLCRKSVLCSANEDQKALLTMSS